MAGAQIYYLNIHEQGGQRIVAVCDCNLIGKQFEEGKKFLDLKAYSKFYAGKKASEKEVLEQLKNFSSLNIVGENATALLVRLKLLDEDQVCTIAGVPFAQAYKI